MKRICLILFVALLAVACHKEECGIELPAVSNDTFSASFSDARTKAYADSDLKVKWHTNDNITVFSTTGAGFEYANCSFEESTNATFVKNSAGSLPQNTLDGFYAVYPYNSDYTISSDKKIRITLPQEQKYAENSFAQGYNPMVAVTSGADDRSLLFKNVCGYLRVRLYGPCNIKSIVLRGNNNEILAGDATVTAAHGSNPAIQMSGNGSKTITLDCGEKGVLLGTADESSTSFWITVPPVDFANGFTVEINTSRGITITKSVNSRVDLKGNTLYTLSAMYLNTNHMLVYSTVDGNPLNMNTAGFGATLVSNTYANGKGIMVFDRDVTTIPDRAFDHNYNLAMINLPWGITEIGERAFNGCVNLAGTVEIPSGVTKIKTHTFWSCKNLEGVTIPAGVTAIGDRAFDSCEKLEGVIEIPLGVTKIESHTFYNCKKLTRIILPPGLLEIEERAFNGCENIEGVMEIPSGVTEIGTHAFYDCKKLTGLVLPAGLTKIGDRAFHYCINLEGILEIPSGVTKIDAYTFYNCNKLSSIYLPQRISEIHDGAFWNCKKVNIYNAVPPTLVGANDHFSLGYTKIYVPASSLNAYKAAWTQYANQIYAM